MDEYHNDSEFYYPDTESDKNRGNVVEKQTTEKQNEDVLATAQKFIEGQRPENTKNKTKYNINVWKRFLLSNQENRNIEDIPETELNAYMCRFFMDIKKKDGDQYEPSTLTYFHRSLQRYLNDYGSKTNKLKDQDLSQVSQERFCSPRKDN